MGFFFFNNVKGNDLMLCSKPILQVHLTVSTHTVPPTSHKIASTMTNFRACCDGYEMDVEV